MATPRARIKSGGLGKRYDRHNEPPKTTWPGDNPAISKTDR